MGTTYLVYYEFASTMGNHAGMAYLARYLDRNLPGVKLVKHVPQEFKYGGYLSRIYAVGVAYYLLTVLKKNDKVFFMEYLSRGVAHQDITAAILRKHGVKNPFYALVHLAGGHLMELYKTEKVLLSKLDKVDKVFVFGSSLKEFLRGIRFPKEVVQTFHYVDTTYYRPGPPAAKGADGLQVICMGNLKRNYTQLRDIVAGTPGVTFHVCMGRSKLGSTFEGLPNARVYGFMEERELLALMQRCDVNLSVLEDTIGSNVITTSLAVGHIQVVSDVGSIRDYCDGGNAFFCTGTPEFIAALNALKDNREKVIEMRQNALKKSAQFSKESFLRVFQTLVLNRKTLLCLP
jgi:glycosyltransferase involved in cell wall biosynthesis